jgi:hypothetical protein
LVLSFGLFTIKDKINGGEGNGSKTGRKEERKKGRGTKWAKNGQKMVTIYYVQVHLMVIKAIHP